MSVKKCLPLSASMAVAYFAVATLSLAAAPLAIGALPDALDAVAANADAAYKARDWAQASPLYERLTQARPESGRNWYRLGVCMQETGKRPEALCGLPEGR